jgi:hypothetical protein
LFWQNEDARRYLFSYLPSASQEAFLLQLLAQQQERFFCTYYNLAFLDSYLSWSARVTREWFAQLQRCTATADTNQLGLMRMKLNSWSEMMPCQMYEEFTQGWPKDSPNWLLWQDFVEELLDALRFRIEMHSALAE